jgi:aminoglycoside phosphotransferase (APT) family kinase protein
MKQFKLGQSNPTFLLIDANDKKLVVRKKPPGALISKTAHAIDREFRVLKALNSTDVPVPKVLHYCKDLSIIGTEFYVMEFLDGRIFSDVLLPTVNVPERKSYYQSIVKTLAMLHSVDFSAVGLSGYGREGGFYERQLSSLYKLSQVQAAVKGDDGLAVGELYRLPEIMKWLTNNMVQDQVTLIHGDFKTDNIVFHPETKAVIGILDWEL